MKYEKDYIVQEIIRTAKKNGGNPLGRQRFESVTGIKETDWHGVYWTKWSDAVLEAGYTPNILKEAYKKEFLIEKLIQSIQETGKFPTNAELRMKARQDKTFPSPNTFQRLGEKHERAQKIVEYCGENEELFGVKEICLPFCKTEEKTKIEKMEKEVEAVGFVYLMKSGKYYKIGRSNDANRRTYELRIQMLEKLELIHQIKTDDPIGIGEYWHKRFEHKRKNGEWFELKRQDVEIFKRRKFM